MTTGEHRGGSRGGPLVGVLAALAAICAAGPAAADVVFPPPDDFTCPGGAAIDVCHGGPICSLRACESDADCSGALACRPTELCISRVNCGGMGGPSYVDSAVASCAGGAPCVEGTCETRRVCLSPEPPPPADASPDGSTGDASPDGSTGDASPDGGYTSQQWGCGCRAGERSSHRAAALGALLFGVLLLGRRGR